MRSHTQSAFSDRDIDTLLRTLLRLTTALVLLLTLAVHIALFQ